MITVVSLIGRYDKVAVFAPIKLRLKHSREHLCDLMTNPSSIPLKMASALPAAFYSFS